MAAPIIDSITVSPLTVQPGQAFVVMISAHDPDALTGTLRGVVTDSQGNISSATVDIMIQDPLTFDLLDVGVIGFAIQERTGSPGVFDCVAP